MRISSTIALVTMALALAACGDDGDGLGTIDAATIDSPPGTIDAGIDASSASALGTACTGMGQGSCPAGYDCLNLTGGHGPFCSKPCADVQDRSCEVGYTGPGFPACIFNVTPSGGGAAVPHCAIICDDPAGNPILCPGGAAQCNMMCPAPLTCSANLTTPQMMVVGKACL